MKKTVIQRILVATMFLLTIATLGWSQESVKLAFTSKPGSGSSVTMSSGDVLHGSDPASFSGSNSSTCTSSGIRVQVKEFILEMSNNSIQAIVIDGSSSGASARAIKSISVSDAKTGVYTEQSGYTKSSTITGSACGQLIASGLTIERGKFVKIAINTTGDVAGAVQNLNLSEITITTLPTGPTISLTQGLLEATGMATLAIDPVVYTYSNVDDATLTWTTDTPAGISVDKNTEAKTLTISGAPTTAGVYGYTVSVAEGNTLTGSLTVSAYTTPTPEITTPSNSSQSKKAGVAIEDIIYHLKYATGATVAGLPDGLTGVYADSQMTISGTLPAASSYPATYTYTVSATPLDGYAGEEVSATGVITVKDPNAKVVAYLNNSATAPIEGSAKYPLFAELSKSFDLIPVVATNVAADTAALMQRLIHEFDMVLIHEEPKSDVLAMLEIGKYIGRIPILNAKVHMYGKANWPSGTGDNGTASNTYVVIEDAFIAHPIFNNIPLDGSELTMMEDGGIMRSLSSSTTFGHTIATVPSNGKGSIVEKNDGLCKYMMIAFGAANEKLSTSGLQVMKNACEYLLSNQIFTPAPIVKRTAGAAVVSIELGDSLPSIVYMSENTTESPTIVWTNGYAPEGVVATIVGQQLTISGTPTLEGSYNYTVSVEGGNTLSAAINVVIPNGLEYIRSSELYFDGHMLHNPSSVSIELFDMAGRSLVRTSSSVSLEQLNRGVYLVKELESGLQMKIVR